MNRNIRVNFLEHPLLKDNKTVNRRRLILFYSLFVVTILLLTQFDKIFLRETFYGYKVGDVVEEEVLLSKSLTFINQEASEKKMKLAMELILPVYVVKDDISLRILSSYDEFYSKLTKIDEDEGNYRAILESMESHYPGIQYLNHLQNIDPVRVNLMLNGARAVIEEILTGGLISHLNESRSGATGLIDIVHSDSGEKSTQMVENSILIDNWQEKARSRLDKFEFSSGEAKFIEMIVYYFLEPNCFFSADLTDLKQQEVMKTMTPVWIHLDSGDKLLSKDTVMTAFEMEKLNAYLDLKGRFSLQNLVAPFFYTFLVFVFLLVLLIAFPGTAGLLVNPNLLFSLSWFHLVSTLLIFRFLSVPGGVPAVLFMPTGLVCILLSLLRNRRETIVFAMVQSVFVFFVLNFNSQAMYMTLFSGLASCLVIEGAEKRIDLIKGGVFLALSQMALAMLMMMVLPLSLKVMLFAVVLAGINGILSGFLSLTILPLFEHILNPCTTFRLQELSDLNAPIIKRMLALAPGTYSHSVNVANMAETGCRNIGANALLARVGAYYHDIGKIDQAKYFSENQKEYNKHDDMKTTLSVAVIKSHVKIGIEMARNLNLPEGVIDIIAQHHGTSVIEYFYQQAVKEKGVENVPLEAYSHSGPRPQSKEAAVVMLADMAEAATRSMQKPTVNKLEKYLWDLIMVRFKDGELNECGMTLQELETVKSSFVHVLTGHYHTRIEYPDREERK
ncbi:MULTISPECIES: HD family phosphohydrolase [unclassified Oceanispirochaeta]|uniref:HD family phosphohydrolase n=1 Tax=unclassified Oceanispirochaeta TaxID=2635722 RepID=UPI000E09B799|nr:MULTISPECIES: HDIG domain-containing metalloprotein [unclassified Oceanispirochaeta]MBF9015055.1 HDIG domain-containing protein [Oceanispirochaeta sp. M2]NPD71513.1 HDIG domain-containing protein [Oceanispirochaeta sp. M1]RDG33087.1 HDIG domain-containing protein [Oceanispirochaeta sp. M1]